jgi:hypothetical protein
MRKKSQKKWAPDWQKLLATLISILIMIAQFSTGTSAILTQFSPVPQNPGLN